MDCTSTKLSYGQTGYFSNIVSAYIAQDENLRPFYKFKPDVEGISQAIEERRFPGENRKVLVQQLREQYASLPASDAVNRNIDLLGDVNTFTICTAHQPAIFTGTLFFVYKILHAIRLAAHLNDSIALKHFVPVFYMGCEDADLDELGHIFLSGEKIVWDTNQKGPVGRMNPKGLEKIINRIEGELSVQPFGTELVALLRESYLTSPDIQTGTLRLLHRLFAESGLIVIIPDNPEFKRLMIPVFEDELLNQRSVAIVEQTNEQLSHHFKVQAHPREINIFYLSQESRQRIQRSGEEWTVVDAGVRFSREQILQELKEHPERFSPNVILRGILQETILPNVAFIGGGGEIAYWMQLQGVFELYDVAYPVLLIRNSFLLIEPKWREKMDRLNLTAAEIFAEEHQLLNTLVKRQSEKQLSLEEEISSVNTYYDRLKSVAGQVDDTLSVHVAALQTRAIKPLHELEKKLLRAEKRKYNVEERHIVALKRALFPNNSLQERVDNFMPFYARWGKEFLKNIYDHSLTTEQQFTVLNCK